MLKQALLAASRSERVKRLVVGLPVSSNVVARYVPGESVESAVAAVAELVERGLLATLDHLGEDTEDLGRADATVQAYLELLAALEGLELAGPAEVSVKPSALGSRLADGEAIALERARIVARAAQAAGTTVTLDMEDHSSTDSTLRILRALRQDFPETGIAIQAYLKRSEADCADLADEGVRVRLCKGAYAEPATVAYTSALDIDRAYVRCLKVLMRGGAYPMIATHDPRLVAIATALAEQEARAPESFEFQMLFGIRPSEQRRLAETGARMRVYIPYGHEWYGYLMRRLAERPGNLALFVRSLVSRS